VEERPRHGSDPHTNTSSDGVLGRPSRAPIDRIAMTNLETTFRQCVTRPPTRPRTIPRERDRPPTVVEVHARPIRRPVVEPERVWTGSVMLLMRSRRAAYSTQCSGHAQNPRGGLDPSDGCQKLEKCSEPHHHDCTHREHVTGAVPIATNQI
jgi:hypothetical protein